MKRRTILAAGAGASAALALGGPAAPASAAGRGTKALLHRWFEDTYRSIEAMHSDFGLATDKIDVSGAKPQSQRPDLADQHRLRPLVHGRGGRSRRDQRQHDAQAAGSAPSRPSRSWSAHTASGSTGTTPTRRRGAHRVARDRRPGTAVPLLRRQRLAGDGSAHRRRRRPVAAPARRRSCSRRPTGPSTTRPTTRPTRRRTPASCTAATGPTTTPSPATGTARSTPSPAWPVTSASRTAACPASTTGAPSARCSRRTSRSRRREGEYVTVDGVRLWRGHYTYRGRKLVPTWGGSMFEALMVPLFVPEGEWSPKRMGPDAQALHPQPDRARPGGGEVRLLGLLPRQHPEGGYSEYGVDAMACRSTATPPTPTALPGMHRADRLLPQGRGHAPRLLPGHAVRAAERPSPTCGRSTATSARTTRGSASGTPSTWRKGTVSDFMLALDQGMVAAALAQVLRPGLLQRPFRSGGFAKNVRPLLAKEDFGIA